MLSISNACKKFGEMRVLQNISITIEKEHIVGLAGSSGSGKSTLLRCIQQLDRFDHGEIKCSGATGFMFQDFQLFPHMNVLENLVYAPNIITSKGADNKSNTNKTLNLKQALNLLKQLGISDKENHYPFQLSGGQKQRVALARSLMMKPDLLLCDEPTSGLDVATIEDVVLLLRSVQAAGVTMIIASHDLDFLSQIAERIIVLKYGQIVADIDTAQTPDTVHYLKKFY